MNKPLRGSLRLIGSRLCIWTGTNWTEGIEVPIAIRHEIERYMKDRPQ